MRDFRVIIERVPLMFDTSAISVVKTPVFHKRMRHLERRNNFLRDHVETGGIEMRYINTKRQLADIFTKPLDASHFVALHRGGRGELVFAILMSWFEGVLCFIFYTFAFLLHFLHIHLSYPLLHVLY
jgi:hypothetical protein